MTNRSNRRRRHKRHKMRTTRNPVRIWSAAWLGREFRAMEEFAANTVQRGTYIDHEGCLAFTDATYVQVARLDVPLDIWKAPVAIATYRLRRRREGRLFYDGRNRRYRELPAVLEEA